MNITGSTRALMIVADPVLRQVGGGGFSLGDEGRGVLPH